MTAGLLGGTLSVALAQTPPVPQPLAPRPRAGPAEAGAATEELKLSAEEEARVRATAQAALKQLSGHLRARGAPRAPAGLSPALRAFQDAARKDGQRQIRFEDAGVGGNVMRLDVETGVLIVNTRGALALSVEDFEIFLAHELLHATPQQQQEATAVLKVSREKNLAVRFGDLDWVRDPEERRSVKVASATMTLHELEANRWVMQFVQGRATAAKQSLPAYFRGLAARAASRSPELQGWYQDWAKFVEQRPLPWSELRHVIFLHQVLPELGRPLSLVAAVEKPGMDGDQLIAWGLGVLEEFSPRKFP